MSKNTVDAIVAKITPNMQLPTVTARPVSVKKSGRGFVVQESLKEETHVAFVSKKSMAKAETQGMVGTGEFRSNMKAFIVEPGRKAEVFQKPTQAPATVIKAIVVPAAQVAINDTSFGEGYSVYLPNITNLNNAISKVSNLIKDYLTIEDVFGQVKNGIHDKKIFENIFYRKIQNCMYHSLRDFCGITKADDNSDILPILTEDMDNLSTLVFFDRIFNHKAVSFEKAPNKVMEKYRSTFDDADGIQYGWLDIFRARVKSKLSLDDSIITKIEIIIMDEWGCEHTTDRSINGADKAIISGKFEYSATPIRLGDVETSVQFPVSPENAAGIKRMIEDAKDADIDEDDDMDDTEEEEDDEAYLSVSIIREEDIDIVKVESSDGYGKVSIPFYTNLGDINMDAALPSIVDPRNDKWDWLVHFVPDLMFRTREPEKYLAGNNDLPEESKIKCVIMDENKGEYVVGVYFISAITLYDREDEGIEDFSNETVSMINKLVNMEVATGHMSHLNRSLSDPTLFRDEEYVLNHVMGGEEDDDDDDCCGHDHVQGSSEVTTSDVAAHVFAEQEVQQDVITQASLAALESMGVGINENVEVDDREEDQQIDPDVVTVAGQTFPMEEEFTFQPIGKKQRLER